MSIEGARLGASEVALVRRLFSAHGYSGELLVVDDQRDEAVFLIPADSLSMIREPDLSGALQDLLGRKVWIVEATPVWVRQARSLG
jgi:hypothetical protein